MTCFRLVVLMEIWVIMSSRKYTRRMMIRMIMIRREAKKGKRKGLKVRKKSTFRMRVIIKVGRTVMMIRCLMMVKKSNLKMKELMNIHKVV
jgi:hypothetical protein